MIHPDFLMKMEYVIDLDDEQLARCKELSYGDEGFMSEDLDAIIGREPVGRRPTYRLSTVCLVYYGDKIVGWSLLQPEPRSPRWSAQFFVDPQYRRRGIGKALLTQANYHCDWKHKPICYVDDDNEDFFSKNPSLFTEV